MDIDKFLEYVSSQYKRRYVHCPRCGQEYTDWFDDIEINHERMSEWATVSCGGCRQEFHFRGITINDFDVAKDANEVCKIMKV